jgi:hypothetical protein
MAEHTWKTFFRKIFTEKTQPLVIFSGRVRNSTNILSDPFAKT